MGEQPNFIVVMTEQHRGDSLSCEGHPVLLTPSIDEIGGRGARFSRAYTSCPICVAARRSFLTGQFPGTHGVFANAGVEWDGPSIAGELTRAGYQTCWVGRSTHQSPPRKRCGFEHMVINDHRIPLDDYDEWLQDKQPKGSGGYYGTGVMHNDWTARPWHMPEGHHHTNWTVNQALSFLAKRDPTCPFFLVVSFIAAHPPLIPPACYFERYVRTGVPEPAIGDWAVPPPNEGVGLGAWPRSRDRAGHVNLTGEALRSTRAAYYGLINHVDDQINRLLNGIDGVDRMTGNNTAVIFTADHGEMLGDHYRWSKGVPYEGSARVPMLIRAPERFGVRQGAVIDKPVGLEDVMPTVLDMAGLDTPDSVEGRSLLPLLRGEDASWRDYIHVQCAGTAFHSLTDGREKYVWFAADGHEQLFDLQQDPTECIDLARAPGKADRVELWRQRLVRELKDWPEGFSDGEKLIPGRPFPGARQ